MSKEKADALGIRPIALITANASAGVDPAIMGTGPVTAVKKVLAKADMTLDNIDLIEANEAFAAQSIAVDRELGFNHDKLNVNGGAIALGHPIGASGARILVTLLHEMEKRDAKQVSQHYVSVVDKAWQQLSSALEVNEKVTCNGKKRKQQQRVDSSVTANLPKQEAVTLADQLGGDVLAKLKAAKQDLTAKEQAAEEERQAKLAFERKQREKQIV